jgi:hypothetical protein
MKEKINYEFIKKTLLFPESGILVIGDLHIGYEHAIRQSGILLPESQINEIIDELRDVFDIINKKQIKLKKVIFLGDIKHSFGYDWQEKNYFREVSDFLKNYIGEKNIIFIKGNHDTVDYSFGKMKNYYIYKNLAFVHGHESFPKVFEKEIKVIVMGHIHPSIILRDKQNIKRERYKCFLTGKFKKKQVIILPSFLNITEGSPVNNYKDDYENYFSIIPKKSLINFNVFVVGEDRVYAFGKVKEL